MRIWNQFLLTFLLMLVLSIDVFGQSFQLEIKDDLDQPLMGVHALHHRTGRHYHSDENGILKLDGINMGDSLSISHVGFKSQQYLVTNLDRTVIQLQEEVIPLVEIMVTPQIDALNIYSRFDMRTNPVNSSQQVLQLVPGLIIGQHAGGGKAEQLFLRGFDLDHGTDIHIEVDGMPVNMVSHAHGQGYADLHFLIPETIKNFTFGKGPYYADKGNFSTAGHVSFQTRDALDYNEVKYEVGRFNTNRLVGLFNLIYSKEHKAYLASEFLVSDGPFESPQNLNRLNLLGKYTLSNRVNNEIGLTVSYFRSNWNASGQIPNRSVLNGDISRFGAIDDQEGGVTSRANFALRFQHQISENAFLSNRLYYSRYAFLLYSNFTFFLNDPVNGDQILQQENRHLFGWKTAYNLSKDLGSVESLWQVGLGFRNDLVNDNELSRTRNRYVTLSNLSLGDVHETNLFGYINARFETGRFAFNPSLRIDQLRFSYQDQLQLDQGVQTEAQHILSPKFNLLYNPTSTIQLYMKGGKGFHTNDTRVAVLSSASDVIPAAYGSDLGLIWRSTGKLQMEVTSWYLMLDQELVYVGDEGIVEPGDKSVRKGLDLCFDYRPFPWISWKTDFNYAIPRFVTEEEDDQFIPLAPTLTTVSKVQLKSTNGWVGALQLVHLADRPANEDNSIVAQGYTLMNMNVSYSRDQVEVGLSMNNLWDVAWNETQFATTSRLFQETEPVEEIHFTPGSPRSISAWISYKF